MSETHTASPGYALGQLTAALATGEEHPDPATRHRAMKKATDWRAVLSGMTSGALSIGTRAPVEGAPTWATLHVVKGGFATGALLAGGEPQAHELTLLERLGGGTAAEPMRRTLNRHYLTPAGMAELEAMLSSGCYRVNVPEEGALLAVSWLLSSGELAEARTILSAITPLMDRLRFYPVPDDRPLSEGSTVQVRTVAEMIDDLRGLQFSMRIEAMRETIDLWLPLTDDLVSLFLETVEHDWPCQRYPEGWAARGRTLLDRYTRLRRDNQLCGRPDDARSNLFVLRTTLATCLRDPAALTGMQVGRLRLALRNILRKRGRPDSAQTRALRAAQARQIAAPPIRRFVPVLIGRLARYPGNDGLATLARAAGALTHDEARRSGLGAGLPIPERLAVKLRRCQKDTPEAHIAAGVITSGEVLAKVIPQLTGQIRAAGIADVGLRRLYHALYSAFRRRRSLLLLDLASQVRFEELPWVLPLHVRRRRSLSGTDSARQALTQVVCTALTAWPQTILPNKLLQEIRALCEAASVSVPITDELAADIFMHAFSGKFVIAAQQAGSLLSGSLYERYYGLDYAAVQGIKDLRRGRYGAKSSSAFYRLCCALAGERGGWGSVAQHGRIIEQGQILTTHNLASLWLALDLGGALAPVLPGLPRQCFAWICAQHQLDIDGWQPRLRMVKNTAYAWRQMVFFLSQLSEEDVAAFEAWATAHLAGQPGEFALRFRPAMLGLAQAIAGKTGEGRIPAVELESYSAWVERRLKRTARAERAMLRQTHAALMDQAQLSRRFLGWSVGPHWLLEG